MKKTQKVMACSFIMLFTLFPAMGYALIAYTTPTQGQNLPLTQQGLNQYGPQLAGGGLNALPPGTSGTSTTTTTIPGVPAPAGTSAPGTQPTTTTTTISSPGAAPQTKEQKVTVQNAPIEENLNIPDRAEPVTLRQICELMIYESNITHGECACPYSPDRIGGQCGSESKYYKPHSDKIYCYYGDITNKDIHFYWLKHGIGLRDY